VEVQELFTAVRKFVLPPNLEHHILDWTSPRLPEVSKFFAAGMEWWGVFLFTVHVPAIRRLTVIAGSTSDWITRSRRPIGHQLTCRRNNAPVPPLERQRNVAAFEMSLCCAIHFGNSCLTISKWCSKPAGEPSRPKEGDADWTPLCTLSKRRCLVQTGPIGPLHANAHLAASGTGGSNFVGAFGTRRSVFFL
jgi:hypothetical protein